jgi:hypothetical protein
MIEKMMTHFHRLLSHLSLSVLGPGLLPGFPEKLNLVLGFSFKLYDGSCHHWKRM